jgi:hypothetical protein
MTKPDSANPSPEALPLKEIIASGLFHCTTPRSFAAIRKEGFIKPNLGDRPHQHGVSHASRCFRLGAVSLFDAMLEPKRNWLRTWLGAHKPFTVAIKLDPEKLDRQKLVSCAEARKLTTGVMLPGEVCYQGEIPLEWALGILLVSVKDVLTYRYLAGHDAAEPVIVEFRKSLRRKRAATKSKQQRQGGGKKAKVEIRGT